MTVAMLGIRFGTIPDIWLHDPLLKNCEGKTVAMIAVENGCTVQ